MALVVTDPVVRTHEIQGDVLVGLQKFDEVFLFFSIANAASFRAHVTSTILPMLTTTDTVIRRDAEIAHHRHSGHGGKLPLIGVNIGFTAAGIDLVLGAGTAAGMDVAFAAGAAARAASLGDPVDSAGQPVWTPAFATGTIHGVLLVTGPGDDAAGHNPGRDRMDAIKAALGNSITTVFEETGATRPQRGHEHFGFLDGVSNPGVRGITARQNPADPEQGFPGQDLLWPGAFVFGYPGQDPNTAFSLAGPSPAMAFSWMQDGSYMVFRRLNQRVPEFRSFLDQQGQALGVDPQLIGARMVGRWQSGAPIMIAPLADEPELGKDKRANNNFEYSQDKGERRCPFGAHIRKAYPRDDLEDPNAVHLPNPEGFVQSHRVLRAGIPFGPEVDDDETTTTQERGLMFVCYQTSIVNQFEFIQGAWVNAPNFPINKKHPDGTNATPGQDPIIGQGTGSRSMDEITPNYPFGNTRSTLPLPTSFVVPTAAGYFFMPSRTALHEVFGA